MSLAGLQRGLTELFTDAAKRENFARDPNRFARRLRLSEIELAQLAALARSAINSYADTLIRKRRCEAARLLPRTREAMGDAAFDAAFERFARRTKLPEGDRRFSRDARAFCRYLIAVRDSPAGVRSIARTERP
jgi:hypothetical protein